MDLSYDLEANVQAINDKLGVGKAFDIKTRRIKVLGRDVQLYYLDGLVNNLEIIGVLEKILGLSSEDQAVDVPMTMYNNITHKDAKFIETIEEVYNNVLNGVIVFIISGHNQGLIAETRNFPTRSISEPDIEKVVRGSHDGFTESLNQNISLVRRRVKDGNMRSEIFAVGNKSSFNVCLAYIEGICDTKDVELARERISSVNIDHLIMADKALEELMIKKPFNLYPLVRYSERADIVAVHLYRGKLAIFVDTSPSVIIAPSTFFDHLQHAEEHRQTPIAGTYLRFVRFLGVFISLFLTPIWLLLTKYEVVVPEMFDIFTPDEAIKISIFLQLIAAEIGIEFLRMASIHTPSALSTAMGLVAGILMGDVAIQVGLLSIQTVFLVAVSAIGSYVTPSYELSLANKLSKLLFLCVIMLFGYIGFIVIVILWVVYLGSMKSLNRRYLYPLFPFNWAELKQILVRKPLKEVDENAETKM